MTIKCFSCNVEFQVLSFRGHGPCSKVWSIFCNSILISNRGSVAAAAILAPFVGFCMLRVDYSVRVRSIHLLGRIFVHIGLEWLLSIVTPVV